jgi:hypothetical protein
VICVCPLPFRFADSTSLPPAESTQISRPAPASTVSPRGSQSAGASVTAVCTFVPSAFIETIRAAWNWYSDTYSVCPCASPAAIATAAAAPTRRRPAHRSVMVNPP